MGYKLILVTNQSGIARGIITEAILKQIHDRLQKLLQQDDAVLDAIYYCPYHPEGALEKFRKDSDLRKPQPGMLLKAAKEMDIDIKKSWMVGDKYDDVEAGLKAGCRTILIEHSTDRKDPQANTPKPDHSAVNFKEAFNIIKKEQQAPMQPAAEPLNTEPSKTSQTLEKPEKVKTPNNTNEKQSSVQKIENTLAEILIQLRTMRKQQSFDEFSVTRFIAGIIQLLALLSLVISIWFLLSPTKQTDSALIALGFAAVFQIMALTFYVMQKSE